MVIAMDDVMDMELFHFPHGEAGLLVLLVYLQNPPEKVALADGADVLAVP